MKRINILIIAATIALSCLMISGCVPKGEAQKHFDNAYEFMNMGMLREAMIELDNAVVILEKDKEFRSSYIYPIINTRNDSTQKC